MTAKIGSLNVDLTLETARFQKGLGDAQRSIAGAQQGIGGLGKAVAAVGTVLAGSAVVSSLKDMAMRGLEFASSLGETAQQLGVTTTELQEYRHAATQVGLAQDEMDAALAKLTRNLGAAANGSKAQADAFAKLGISIRDANGNIKTAGAIIPDIAEALKGIPDPAQRAALLVDMFGKSGQKLEPLLSEGAAGVNALRDAAHRLGIVLSNEQIQNADKVADDMAALNQVLEAKLASVVADNAKEIIVLANAMATLVDKAGAAIRAWQNWRKEVANKNDQAIVDGWLTSDADKAAAAARIRARNGVTGKTIVAGGGGAGGPKPAPGSNKFNPALPKNLGGLPADSWTGGPGAPKVLRRGANLGGGSFKSGFQQSIDAAGGGVAIDSMEQYRRSLALGIAATEEMADKSEDATVRVARSFKDMADDTLSAMRNLANSIKGGGFLDILSSVIGLATQLGSIGAFGKKVQTNINKTIPAYANGTSFHPGGLALVGERGPELLHLPRGSAVTPNGKFGSTHVMVTASPFFDVRVQQNIDQAAPAIASAGGAVGQRRMAHRQMRRLA